MSKPKLTAKAKSMAGRFARRPHLNPKDPSMVSTTRSYASNEASALEVVGDDSQERSIKDSSPRSLRRSGSSHCTLRMRVR